MAEKNTVARPYANAIFSEAKSAHALEPWSVVLEVLSQIMEHQPVSRIATDPRMSKKMLESLFLDLVESIVPEVFQPLSHDVTNLIRVLIEKKRLDVLPNIAVLYHRLVLEEQRVIEVEAISAVPLSDDHRQRIEKALEKRFNSKVKLHAREDEALIGGILIRSDNWVMDNSIRGKLEKLNESLMG